MKLRSTIYLPAAAVCCAAGAFFLAFGLVGGSLAQSTSWQFEAIGIGIKPALSVDAQGIAHVAYLREAIPGATYYATNKTGEWVSQRAAEGYFYGPVDIDTGPDGVALITYHDHEKVPPDPNLGSGVVLTVNADGFASTRIDHPGHDQWDVDIAASGGGIWHVAGVDPRQFGSRDGLEYATNAFGDIRVENVGSGPMLYEFGVSIEVAPEGVVGISYHNTTDEDLIYAERAPGPGGTWSAATVEAQGNTGRYSDLAYDAQGRPHISFWVFDSRNAGRVRYATRAEDGSWTIEDVGELSNVEPGQLGARKITAIELDSGGVPHIMYGDKAEIKYAIRAGGNWGESLVRTAGSRPLGQLVEFDLDAGDTPHLVFFEATGREGSLPALAGEVFYGTMN